jgi:hypothetical protein
MSKSSIALLLWLKCFLFFFRFFLASFYTKYDTVHFVINLAALGLGVIPKLPQLHGVRIFGINKW